MTHSLNKCSAQETAACCCVDVGTIIDNEDCTVSDSKVFAGREEAEAALALLTEAARAVESDPCLIDAKFKSVTDGVELNTDFTFCCEVEKLRFQLALR